MRNHYFQLSVSSPISIVFFVRSYQYQTFFFVLCGVKYENFFLISDAEGNLTSCKQRYLRHDHPRLNQNHFDPWRWQPIWRVQNSPYRSLSCLTCLDSSPQSHRFQAHPSVQSPRCCVAVSSRYTTLWPGPPQQRGSYTPHAVTGISSALPSTSLN